MLSFSLFTLRRRLFRNTHKRLLLRLLTTLFSLFFLSSNFAETSQRPYQVNMIIFARNDIEWLNPEQTINTRNQSYQKATRTLLPLHEGEEPPPAFTLMPQKDFALNDELNKLMASPKYKVLLAFSWWQPFGSKSDWQTIRISGGELYDQYHQTIPFAQQAWLLDLMPHNTIWQLDGTIHITLDHYLNATLDMQYLTPNKKASTNLYSDDTTLTFTPMKVFKISDTVRTRSEITNYIDNPAFGVLLRFEHYQPTTTNNQNTATKATEQ